MSSLKSGSNMKLLDRMQTNNEPPTEFAPRNSCSCLMATGQPSLDDLQHYPKSRYYANACSIKQREGQFRKSFSCIEAARGDDEQAEEESAAVFSELFHGFLATETDTNEIATPTFATYLGNKVGNKTEAKENELKPVDEELEKILEPIGKENGAVVCPLQEYLFGSVTELPETVTVHKEKEHRTTLGVLFQRTKMVAEANGGKNNSTERLKEKETEKSVVYLMKKILKGRTLNSSSRHSTTADKKQRKNLQMFHRKVHCEGLRAEPKSEDHLKHAKKGNITEEQQNRNQMMFEDITLFPKVDTLKNGANCMPHSVGDSDEIRECWITSDADYLVLELYKAKKWHAML